MSRLFLAVRPDDATRDLLEGLDRSPAPGVRWVPPEQWHVTLRFWADADPGEIIEALDAVRLPEVTIDLGPVVSRMGPSSVVLPATGADPLAAAVRAATNDIPPREHRPFVGHLTLARLRHRAACGVAGERFTARFVADSVELVESELLPTGARHRVLRTWPTHLTR
jgi:2'-5' RNA ligase